MDAFRRHVIGQLAQEPPHRGIARTARRRLAREDARGVFADVVRDPPEPPPCADDAHEWSGDGPWDACLRCGDERPVEPCDCADCAAGVTPGVRYVEGR
jgi:hypothetical protein